MTKATSDWKLLSSHLSIRLVVLKATWSSYVHALSRRWAWGVGKIHAYTYTRYTCIAQHTTTYLLAQEAVAVEPGDEDVAHHTLDLLLLEGHGLGAHHGRVDEVQPQSIGAWSQRWGDGYIRMMHTDVGTCIKQRTRTDG
jgi:hypothetical protein